MSNCRNPGRNPTHIVHVEFEVFTSGNSKDASDQVQVYINQLKLNGVRIASVQIVEPFAPEEKAIVNMVPTEVGKYLASFGGRVTIVDIGVSELMKNVDGTPVLEPMGVHKGARMESFEFHCAIKGLPLESEQAIRHMVAMQSGDTVFSTGGLLPPRMLTADDPLVVASPQDWLLVECAGRVRYVHNTDEERAMRMGWNRLESA